MKIHCPNINSKAWKELEKDLGKDRAYLAYFRHDKGIPTVEEAKGYLEGPKFQRTEEDGKEKENEPGLNLRVGNTIKKGVPVEGQHTPEKPPTKAHYEQNPNETGYQQKMELFERKPEEPYNRIKLSIKDASGKEIPQNKSPTSMVTAKIMSGARFITRVYNELTDTKKFDDYLKALGTLQGNTQRWGQKAVDAAAYVKKMTGGNKDKAEALTSWREAGGDRIKLLQQRDKTDDPGLRKSYEEALRLNDEEKSVADWVGKQYDALLDQAMSRGLVEHGVNNYVTHLIDPEGTKPGGFGGRLVSGFKFGKERSIPTVFAAEQYAKDIKNSKAIVAQLGKTAPDANKLLAENPNFRVPKNIGDLLALYIDQLGKAIETKDFIKALTTGKAPDGKPICAVMGSGEATGLKGSDTPENEYYIVKPHVLPEEYKNYKGINHYAMTDWKWISSTPDGERVIMKGDLAVHPAYYKSLKNFLSNSPVREWMRSEGSAVASIPKKIAKGILYGQALNKQLMFSFSPFHYVQEGVHGIGHAGLIHGKFEVNPFKVVPVDLNDPDTLDAARHGLMLRTDFDGMAAFKEGLSSGMVLYKIPKIGPIIKMIHEPLFTKYIPSLKIQTYKAMLQRNMKAAKKDLEAGKVTKDDVAYLTARQTNRAYGHLNYAMMGENKGFHDLMSINLLAPDFLRSRVGFVGQAAKFVIAPHKLEGREQFIALATLAGVFFVAARILNKLEDDDYHWDEPFSVIKGNRRYGLRSVPEDIWRFYKNYNQFIAGRVSPIIGKTFDWLRTHKDYRGQPQPFTDFLKDVALGVVPISFRKNKDIEWYQSFLTSMGLQISRYSKVTEVYQLADDWKKKKGIPEKEDYPISKTRDIRNQLQDDNFDKAKSALEEQAIHEQKIHPEYTLEQTKARLIKSMMITLRKPLAGSKRDELLFKRSLNLEQKDAVKRAEQEKIIILKRADTLYNQIKAEGLKEATEKENIPKPEE